MQAGPGVPTFVDETLASGVDHVNSYVATPESPDGGWEFIVGGGLAVLDCDGDSLPDLYLAGGSSPASLYRNVSDLGGPLRFERLSSDETDLIHVTGAYPVDIDSDDVVDLVVLRRGPNAVLRGLGDCRFEPADSRLGVDGGGDWTTAFSATWEGEAALPTLAFGNYQALDAAGELVPGTCADQQLYRPRPGAARYGPPVPLSPGWCTLSMLFSDWDRSGRRDLRVSNDRQYYVNAGSEQLWRIEEGAAPREYGAEDGWERVMIFGMGIASEDVTGDGYPEVYLTTMGHNRLLTLADGPEQPAYENVATDLGASTGRPVAGSDTRPSTAWHPQFEDVNNDGYVDLYVSKGNLDALPDQATEDPSSLLLQGEDGNFVERAEAAGIANDARARGAALVDLNLDGLLDLVEVNLGDQAEVWRNAGAGTATEPAPMGGWLAVELAQDGPNRDAIGAWIEVRRADGIQQREVTVGGGHVSGQLGPTHFGLGAAEAAEVRVTWPDGEVGAWMPVAADQRIRIERGREQALALTSATELTGALPLVREGAEGPVLPPVPAVDPATCVPSVDPEVSVARLWDEALLDAVRRDFPAPTVHARNLYHASAAMWDAWAAYEPDADGVFYTGKASAADVAAARDEAVSYAAYRLLGHRYRDAAGGAASLRRFDELMAELCYPWALEATDGDSPASLGNRVAATHHRGHHGRRLARGPGLRLARLRAAQRAHDRAAAGHASWPTPTAGSRWRWRSATPRTGSCCRSGRRSSSGPTGARSPPSPCPQPQRPGLPIDPGPPPFLHDPATAAEFKAKALEVVAYSSTLDPRDGVIVDIGPATWGNAPLGTQRAGRPRLQPLDQPALRAGARAARRLRPGAGRVLGRRARLRDAAGPLEHARQRGRGPSRLRAPHRRRGTGARPARVGREAVPRAQRRGPRCGRRGLGRQGPLRLRAPHQHDPLDGRPGPVERPRAALVPPRRPAPHRGPGRARHRGLERARRAPRASRATTSARSPCGPGPATPAIPPPSSAGSTGSVRSSGCPTSSRPS